MTVNLNQLANAVRFLSIDAVQKANSGHPGMPMGMADVATVLFKDHLKFNPQNPSWANRDRFILSAGHGSMLLYSLLHLTGYKNFSINDLKNFRQLNSICAGHPEYKKNTGIETTTGPLGQGLANSVGLAIGEEIFRKKFGSKFINHKTYVIASDGDLMEGISHEAMSLAGHLKLKNLIVFFDNNKISIDGSTSLSVSDNYKKRFESYNWNFIEINGHNHKQISSAIKKASKSSKPTVISCKTVIGYGSPNKSGKASSHGSPLGDDEIALVRKKLKWNSTPFEIPKDILKEWRKIGEKGKQLENQWNKLINKNQKIKNLKVTYTGKLAISNDNFIYSDNNKYISNEESLLLTHILRANYNSILIGKNTYLIDKPLLDTRLIKNKSNNLDPIKFVLWGSDKNITNFIHEDFIFLTDFTIDGHKNVINLGVLNLQNINNFFTEINNFSVLIEGGNKVHKYFIENDYYDNFYLFLNYFQ